MRSAIILVVLLSAAPSYAQRPSTLSMSCAEAQGVVASQGAIVLSTGRHTYDRFVATPGFCLLGEWAEPRTAPTADARQCRLGYVCQSGSPPWEFDGGVFDR